MNDRKFRDALSKPLTMVSTGDVSSWARHEYELYREGLTKPNLGERESDFIRGQLAALARLIPERSPRMLASGEKVVENRRAKV